MTGAASGDPAALGAATAGGRCCARALSVGVATGAYGISFGALSVAAGLSLWQTMALSLLLFSGGSQFALVGHRGRRRLGALGRRRHLVACSGVRNGLYGLQVSRLLDVRGAGGLPPPS